MLKDAKQVLILAGRASRSEEAWNARVALAEALNARVVSDLKIGATFPTDHPLYVGAPRAVAPESVEGLKNVDVVLSLDWVDLAGALRYAGPNPSAKVIQISLDHRIHNGWSRTTRALPPVDLLLSRPIPTLVVPELVAAIGKSTKPHALPSARTSPTRSRRALPTSNIARCLAQSVERRCRSPTPICRCRGTTPGRHSSIRSTMSAPTAAAALAADPAFRSARRWRSRAPAGCRWRSAATAIS